MEPKYIVREYATDVVNETADIETSLDELYKQGYRPISHTSTPAQYPDGTLKYIIHTFVFEHIDD